MDEREILRHLPLVHHTLVRLAAHLPLTVDRDDLFQVGVIGLMSALKGWNPIRGALSTYAILRIRGEMIDYLRQRDWVPRGARERSRVYLAAVRDLLHTLGRPPTLEETAAHMGAAIEDMLEIEQEALLVTQVSFDGPVNDDHLGGLAEMFASTAEEADPAHRLKREDGGALVKRLLAQVTEQQRTVLTLYYLKGHEMKAVGTIMGVTESRVCQIHKEALEAMRSLARESA